MEVLIHQVNREVVVEQPQAWRPDGGCGSESAANGGGIGFSGPVNVVKNVGFGLSEESSRVYSDVKEGNTLQWPLLEKNDLKVDDIDIPKLINSIINTQNPINNLKDNLTSFPTSSSEDNKDRSHAQNEESLKIDLVEESDEEVVELEFVKAVDKIHTHTPHCPNCSSQITKVILRRKKRQDTARSADLGAPRRGKTLDLFGCLSCFSIFIPSGNVLNPFRLFGAKGKHESARTVGDEHAPGVDLAAEPGASADGSTTIKQGNVNPFRPVGAKGMNGSAQTVGDEHAPGGVDLAAEPRTSVDGSTTIKQGKHTGESNGEFRHIPLDAIVPVISGHPVHQSGHSAKFESPKPGHVSEITPVHEYLPTDHLTINVGDGTENIVERGSDVGGSEPVEIVKCMVYGGLMELITSLSIVSSAAASGASTLNILGLGLATLISGMFVFGHNLVDLKNDTYERNSNERQIDRYRELLGNRLHFPLHATLTILSFLISGLVPPVVYAFTFYKSDNKDYKILAVAAASFACIVVLAAAQAYVRGMRKASDCVKVVMYYVMAAVAASGVAYAAGDLIRMLMERLGWFGAGTPTAGVSGTAAWASY